MSQSIHVYGFVPPDEKFLKMKLVWNACEAAKVPVPKEVQEFFGGTRPDPAGVEFHLTKHSAVKPYEADMISGYDIDVKKLPPDVTLLRVYVSY